MTAPDETVPCPTSWVRSRTALCDRHADGWHHCVNGDATHTVDHQCACGATNPSSLAPTPDEVDLAGIEPRSPECLTQQPSVHGSCDGTAVGGPHCACPCHIDMHSHLGPTAAQFTEAMREGKARMRAVGLDVDREIDLVAGTRRRAIVAKVLYKTMSTKESFDLAAEILAALDEDHAERPDLRPVPSTWVDDERTELELIRPLTAAQEIRLRLAEAMLGSVDGTVRLDALQFIAHVVETGDAPPPEESA